MQLLKTLLPIVPVKFVTKFLLKKFAAQFVQGLSLDAATFDRDQLDLQDLTLDCKVSGASKSGREPVYPRAYQAPKLRDPKSVRQLPAQTGPSLHHGLRHRPRTGRAAAHLSRRPLSPDALAGGRTAGRLPLSNKHHRDQPARDSGPAAAEVLVRASQAEQCQDQVNSGPDQLASGQATHSGLRGAAAWTAGLRWKDRHLLSCQFHFASNLPAGLSCDHAESAPAAAACIHEQPAERASPVWDPVHADADPGLDARGAAFA